MKDRGKGNREKEKAKNGMFLRPSRLHLHPAAPITLQGWLRGLKGGVGGGGRLLMTASCRAEKCLSLWPLLSAFKRLAASTE